MDTSPLGFPRAPHAIGHDITGNGADNEKRASLYHQGGRPKRASNGSRHYSHSHTLSAKSSNQSSPRSSISSGPYKHRLSPEIHHAQDDTLRNLSYPARAHLDPEKAGVPSLGQRSPQRMSSPPREAIYDSGNYDDKEPEEKAVQLLIFLSGPCALLSFAILFWTIISVIIATTLQPLRLISKRPSLSSQLTTFLAPPLNLQLQLIYSHASSNEYSPGMLLVIHLFSPIVAVGVAIAAWTAACFWFFSAILGDPTGQDHHNDGKESILGVRNWWDRWLTRGLR